VAGRWDGQGNKVYNDGVPNLHGQEKGADGAFNRGRKEGGYFTDSTGIMTKIELRRSPVSKSKKKCEGEEPERKREV